MSKEHARLSHLLEKMSARYGDQDAEVLRLREAVQRLAVADAHIQAPLRYVDVPLFADRATRLAKFKPASEQWG
ncbi:hypothetical protein RCH10_005095 [Variovorax sp. GrIS 2.14]|uniref:hypothetical protein n=1 Tax=Variovorax sp. GrIS 2.14 TaxID=3071709 RepID=UPI0038F809DD